MTIRRIRPDEVPRPGEVTGSGETPTAKAAPLPRADPTSLPAYARGVVQRGTAGEGSPLPAAVQQQFGGEDLSSVRVHADEGARQANERLHSHAFTAGEHIATTDAADTGLLAHEVSHVLQQRNGLGTSEQARSDAESEAESAARAGGPQSSRTPASGRIAASPAQLASGEVVSRSSGDAGGAPAVQLAPNQAGTTDPSYVVSWVRTRQAAGGSPGQIMTALSDAHAGNTNRYFYTDTYGWVDVRHFGAAASMAASAGSVVTEGLGVGNEVVQWMTEWGDDYRSGFSPEDIPSNAAGAEFGDDYIGSRSGETVADALDRWMTAHGARPASDPRAGRTGLPATDPSERGGAGRGSSNASRTQSTASGAASDQVNSVEQGVNQFFDPMNWIRMYGG